MRLFAHRQLLALKHMQLLAHKDMHMVWLSRKNTHMVAGCTKNMQLSRVQHKNMQVLAHGHAAARTEACIFFGHEANITLHQAKNVRVCANARIEVCNTRKDSWQK